MKILVTILTSNDVQLLDISFASVLTAIGKLPPACDFEFVPLIVVNTLSPTYASKVRQVMADRHGFQNIIETPSNGKPGKGHNSVYEYFQQHAEYDWLFPIDGDDIVYDTVFLQLACLLKEASFDVLLYLGMDRVSWGTTAGGLVLAKGITLLTCFEEENHLASTAVIPPFTAEIANLQVPVRICILNREARDLWWDEELDVLVDYAPFLKVFEGFTLGTLSVAGTSNRYMYIYNMLNRSNVTHRFAEEKAGMRARFHKSIGAFEHLTHEWDRLREIPFIRTSDDAVFVKTVANKAAYITNTLLCHYSNTALDQMTQCYQHEQWTEFLNLADSYFSDFGNLVPDEVVSLIYTNLGVCLYKLGKIEEALQHWRTALQVCPGGSMTQTLQNNIRIVSAS
jgi:hypothetical protein